MVEFAAVVDSLVDPVHELDAPLALLEQLEPVRTCLDGASLDAERPVPIEADRRRATEGLRERLAQAGLASEFGRYAEAVTLARAVVEDATQLGYRPIQAEAELGLAMALHDADQLEEATTMVERAHLSAQASRHTMVLADAAVLRVQLAYQAAEIDEGLAWLAQAEAANEAAGGDPVRSVRLYDAACVLQLLAGAYDEAVRQCERGQELIDGGAAIPVAQRLAMTSNLAMAEGGAGLLERADRRFAAARSMIEAELGPTEPMLINVQFNWGHVGYERGDFDAALAHYQQALSLIEAGSEAPNSIESSILVGIADAQRELGQLDEAEARYNQALALEQANPDFWTTHVARSGLTQVHWLRGDPQAAVDEWSQQLEDERAQLGDDHPWLVDLDLNIAAAQADLGQVDEALARIDAAIARLEAEYGPMHSELVDDLQVRAAVARRAKRWDRCVADSTAPAPSTRSAAGRRPRSAPRVSPSGPSVSSGAARIPRRSS